MWHTGLFSSDVIYITDTTKSIKLRSFVSVSPCILQHLLIMYIHNEHAFTCMLIHVHRVPTHNNESQLHVLTHCSPVRVPGAPSSPPPVLQCPARWQWAPPPLSHAVHSDYSDPSNTTYTTGHTIHTISYTHALHTCTSFSTSYTRTFRTNECVLITKVS